MFNYKMTIKSVTLRSILLLFKTLLLMLLISELAEGKPISMTSDLEITPEQLREKTSDLIDIIEWKLEQLVSFSLH